MDLISGETQIVLINERWHSDRCRDYNYCGLALKNGKVHDFMNTVKEFNRKIKDGSVREIKA